MSHIVTIKTQLKDIAAIRAACTRRGLEQAKKGVAQMYGGQQVQGALVHLKDWRYPIAIMEDGSVEMDNFNGCWGDQKELDAFTQAYAVEKAKIEARKKGLACTEQAQADGSIKLTIREY